jgi:hypothetical protein
MIDRTLWPRPLTSRLWKAYELLHWHGFLTDAEATRLRVRLTRETRREQPWPKQPKPMQRSVSRPAPEVAPHADRE